MPTQVAPMKAGGVGLPPDDAAWGYEVKWDGMRAIAFAAPGDAPATRFQAASLADITVRFPELHGLADALAPHRVVLDGEIVRFDEKGRPNFGRLQYRMHVASAREAAQRANEAPVCYLVFDVIHLDGNDTTQLPYTDRRRLVESLVPVGDMWRVPAAQVGDGASLLEAADAQGLEGLVAKRLDSTYEIGRRSPAWRKVKVRRHQEFVVGGWHAGSGTREGVLGALHIGYYEDGALRYAGRVGTGFKARELAKLTAQLEAIASPVCPFDPPPPRLIARDANWTEPRLVAEVAFAEWTDDGVLRHPAYLGLRIDKDPADVRREPSTA
jgi:bifunctional non-homologous end joining protein LigD